MKKFDIDVAVIGSGAAGGTAALMTAGAGLKTVLIEAGEWGGANLNRRDIPYLAASRVSQAFASAVEASKFGVSSNSLKYNFPTVSNWIETTKAKAGANSKKDFEEAGIECISGFAQFVSPNEISISGHENIQASKFIIATGAVAKAQKITGANEAGCLLPEDVFRLKRLPKVALVVGGGPTGCEIAEYLAEMGTKVVLMEISERLLPNEDPEAGEVIEKRLSKTLGVKVITSARVTAVQSAGKSELPSGRKISVVKASFISAGVNKSVKVESVVLATGTEPAVDLGLNNAGIEFSSHGIRVNGAMQSSTKNIYACGDVADVVLEKHGYVVDASSTEKASYEAATAASNIVNRTKILADYTGFVRMVNTFPKVAATGYTEDECIARGWKYKQTLVPLSSVSAANTSGYRDGFVKLVVSLDNKILGATVVAPEADLLIQEIILAIKMNMRLIDLAATPHVATGWGEAVRVAARRASRA